MDTAQAVIGNACHYHRPKPFASTVEAAFQQHSRLIFICSTGIVIRTLAPLINTKQSDPAILVLDQDGQSVISLLSGHEGGANEWARQLAAEIDATPIITSAENYTRPVYTLGIGCDRGCPAEDIASLVQQSFAALPDAHKNLALTSIQRIASIDLKADEVGLLSFCQEQQQSLETFSARSLRTVEEQLSYKSDIVFKEVGCYGVAEAAALLAASAITNKPSELVLHKHKSKRATCAIALSYP